MKTLHEWIAKGAVSSEIAERYGFTELVRCKDCKNHLECDYWIENGDDWFCADGERRTDDA